jgi:hypothetical protein
MCRYLLLQGRIIGLIVAEIKELSQLAKEDRSILASSFRKGTKVGYILSLGNCSLVSLCRIKVKFFLLYLDFFSFVSSNFDSL